MNPADARSSDLNDWLKVMGVTFAVVCGITALLMFDAACSRQAEEEGPDYDPLSYARQHDKVDNPEATVPSMCYTKTAGVSNPCWTCHTDSRSPNEQADWELQEEYSFSEFALTNRWSNLFVDRTSQAAAITDDEALAWIRGDNYKPLVKALKHFKDYAGYRPDLDFDKGFDNDGFAKDGSRWRALHYKPFLGTFWPTNGSTDDVFIRLPARFEQDAQGRYSREVARLNYAILEAGIRADFSMPDHQNAALVYDVEPVNEALAGADLDHNGSIGGTVSVIKGLPARFAGGAANVMLERYRYPEGTEFLHSVRYLDPDAPSMIARRMKELRYSKKVRYLDSWGLQRAYEKEAIEKQEGVLPFFAGGSDVGLINAFGWQLQGFIEDEKGRLRLQSRQEQYFCMGCHSALGVTVDQSFSFARKLPGKAGWAYQSLVGMHDAPQAGHADPEVLTYFRRVRGGDEFRANDEILTRFFPGGTLNEAEVRRAAKGGDRDLAWLLAPSRPRALTLTKAYMALVKTQQFELGRDTLLAPPANVYPSIVNGDTELGQSGLMFKDGRLWLDWSR